MNNNQPPVGQRMLTDHPVDGVQQPTEQEMWDSWDDGHETEYWSFMKCVEKGEIQDKAVGNTLLFETDTYSHLLASTNIMTILEEVTARMGNLDSCIRRTVFGYLRVVDFSLTDSQQQKMKVATRDERRKSTEASATARVMIHSSPENRKKPMEQNPNFSQTVAGQYNDEKKTKGIEDNKLITICAVSFLIDGKIITSVDGNPPRWGFELTASLNNSDLLCVQEIAGQITSLMETMGNVMNGLLAPANNYENEDAKKILGSMTDDQKCFLLFILLPRANGGLGVVDNLVMRIIRELDDFFLEKVGFGAEEVIHLAKSTGIRYVAHLCKYIIYTSGVETMKYSLIKGQRKANEKVVGSPEAQSKLVALFMRADPREQTAVSSNTMLFIAAFDVHNIGVLPPDDKEGKNIKRKILTKKEKAITPETWKQFSNILDNIVLVEGQAGFEILHYKYKTLIDGTANEETDKEKKKVLRSIKELIDFEDKREKEKDEKYEKEKMHETFKKRRSFFTDTRARTRTGGNVPLLCENLCNNELDIEESQKLMVSMCLTLLEKKKLSKKKVKQIYTGRTCKSTGVTHTKKGSKSAEKCGFCSPILDLLDTCGEAGIDLYYRAIEDTEENKELIKTFNKEVSGYDDDITFSFNQTFSSSSGNPKKRPPPAKGSNPYTLINKALNDLNRIVKLVGNESIEIREILKFESLSDSVKLEMIAIVYERGGGDGFIKLVCKIMAYNILEEIQEITKLDDDDGGIDMEFTDTIYDSLETVITKLSPGDVANDWRQTVGWLSSLFAPITRDGKLGRGVELEHLLAIAVQIIIAGGLPEATTEEGKNIIMQMLKQHIISFPTTEINPGLSLALMGLTGFTAKLGKFLFSDPEGNLTITTVDKFYDFFTSRYHLTKNELLLSYMDPNQIKSDLNMIRMSALRTMNGVEPIFRPDRTTVVNFTYSLVSCITTANQDILRKAAMGQLHKCVIEKGNVCDENGKLKAIRILGDRTKVLEKWMFGLTGGTQVVSGCQLDKEDVVIFYREDPDSLDGENKIYMKILLKEITTVDLNQKLLTIQGIDRMTPEEKHIESCMYTKLRHRAQDGKLLKRNNDPNSRTVSLNRVRTKEKFFWENTDGERVRGRFSAEDGDSDSAFETGCICLDSISGRSKCISRGDIMQAKLEHLDEMNITDDLKGILNGKMTRDKKVILTVVDCGFSLNQTDIVELLDEYKMNGLMEKAPTGMSNDSMQDFHTLCNHKGKSKFILCELNCRRSVQVELKEAAETDGAPDQYQLLKSGHEYFQELAESLDGKEGEGSDDDDSLPELDDDEAYEDDYDMETVDGGGGRKSIKGTRRHKKNKGNTRRKRKYLKKTKKRKRRRKKRTRRK